MTDLTKAVTRRTEAVVFECGARRVIVRITPAAEPLIEFRLERQRKWYASGVATLAQTVMRRVIETERRNKKAAQRQARRDKKAQ